MNKASDEQNRQAPAVKQLLEAGANFIIFVVLILQDKSQFYPIDERD